MFWQVQVQACAADCGGKHAILAQRHWLAHLQRERLLTGVENHY